TGAAILAALVDEFRTLNEFSIDRVGYGAGTKQFQDFPNCLRLMRGSEKNGSGSNASTDLEDFHQIMVLEANIDDMAPQKFAYVTERLLDTGALDVSTIPIQMKKGRPGCMLQVL